MASIKFSDFYAKMKEEIDSAIVTAKISKLPSKKSEAVKFAMDNESGKKIQSLYIVHKEEKLGKNESKKAYIAFVTDLFMKESNKAILASHKWFFEKADADNSPKDYAQIGTAEYIYTNCNTDLLMIKCVKILLDLNKEDELKDYEFVYEYKSSNGENDRDNFGSALADEDIETTHYWMYTIFDDDSWEDCYSTGKMVIGVDEIGEFTQYTTKEEMRQKLMEAYGGDSSRKNQALMAWEFTHVMKPQDIVFAKKGNTLVGKGLVLSDYYYDASSESYRNVREVKWIQKGEWMHPGNAVAKRLTDITAYTEYVEKLLDIFAADSEEYEEPAEKTYPPYKREDFLHDVFMDEKDYDTLIGLVRKKKNVILQGAPGVGKTFAAKRLAYSMMNEKNQDRIMLVQFHQSYSYEDFIEGFRPTESGGFEIKKGAFYKFCKKASSDKGNEYFFIIDEINRGNISKIFGELFMLIENDKRDNPLQLLYSGEKFEVPKNVYIIGMMNTADRSLALIDYALRRRFAFFDMKPGFESKGFQAYRDELSDARFNNLLIEVENLNNAISSDDSLGEGFCIGHSYFCQLNEITEQVLANIVNFELVPLLKEYWFDEPAKVKEWRDKLWNAIR